MRKFRMLLGAGIAGACALAVLPGVALAAPAASYTALTVDLGEHRPLPVIRSATYNQGSAMMRVLNEPDGLFRIEALALGNPTDVRAALVTRPPSGQTWEVGRTYPTAPLADAAHARLDLTSSGRSCAQSSGSITVQELQQDPATQVVNVFAAVYRFTCAGQTSPIMGEVRFNSSLEYVAAGNEWYSSSFGSQHLGDSTSKTIHVWSNGSASADFGSVRIGGTDPGQFNISEDHCSGRTVRPGSRCMIVVKPRLTRAGVAKAVIYLPDNTPAGKRAMPVEATGVDGVKGSYYPIAPSRLLDTRSGLGGRTGKLGPNASLTLQVAGRGGVPASGVAAVVLNLTVTGSTASSFLTVYPSGGIKPEASSVNFPTNWLGSNNVTAMLGADGKVSIYNRAGYTHVVADVLGFYAGTSAEPAGLGRGGQYRPLKPLRLFDSRTDHRGALPAGAALNGWVDFAEFGQVDYNKHVRALVLNITAVSPQKDGFLTAWSGENAVPDISTVNYRAGKVVPNLAYVKTQPCPSWGCGVEGAPRYMIHSSATTHLVVDLVGVIDDGTVADGLRLRATPSLRIVDSRIGRRLRPLNPGETGRVDLSATTQPGGVLGDDTRVLVMNVTGIAAERNTVLTVWPADTDMAKPTASNLNPEAGQIVSNGVLGELGPQDAFNVHNLAGYTQVIADLAGQLYLYPGTASPAGASTLAAGPQWKVAGSGVSGYARR
ncbi:hypothetical protein ABZ807_28420 [Micromonospora sp. NPDC047548]|uniref:hypothetical protein n=1 Tax=Micromonospora sp. NPDC047548 TaxID=3155624 RepID=UPI0033C1428E